MRAELYIEAQRRRSETMSQMRDAKAAYKAAKQAYKDARTDAQCSLADLLEENGPMTTLDIKQATGLDSNSIRSLIAPESRYHEGRAIRTRRDSYAGCIKRDHVNITRTYALMNEDGTVDTSQTTKRTMTVNRYTVTR